MIWLAWRQFRAQALAALILLAGATVYFVATGLRMHQSYTTDLATCGALNDCDSVLDQFRFTWGPPFQLNQLLVVLVPALIGIFWGAPLIGRELETGTYQVAWNQTVTRNRWLGVKLTVVGLASVATAGLLSYLLTWWAGPIDQMNGDRFTAMTFSSRDIVPFAYAAFAFALGTTMGLLLRRTVAAMAVTLVVFIAIQILVPAVVRPHLLPSTTTTFAINATTGSLSNGIDIRGGNLYFNPPVPAGAWVISGAPVQDASGRAVMIGDYPSCFPPPVGVVKFKFDPAQISQCLGQYNLHETVTYQPASHYWPLQWFESGIFLALAAALSGTCFWWIRRRRS
ncbi:MAG TPA: ABC transporter permease subunit [Micromonosporaceae bacterium]|jgi:ABC-type transport system involved in multi-copper enzyme maturation permease subunit